MRVVIQRVKEASVAIGGHTKSQIRTGLLVLLGIEEADSEEDIDWLCRKIVALRVFDDDNGVTKKGSRPSYIRAARPETAIPLYEKFCTHLTTLLGKPIGTGEFGADMQVSLTNDGPVTICIDTKNKE